MPEVMAVCASSAALALSEVPFPKPVAAVRVGYILRPSLPPPRRRRCPRRRRRRRTTTTSMATTRSFWMRTAAVDEVAAEAEEERVLVINPTREQLASSTLDLSSPARPTLSS